MTICGQCKHWIGSKDGIHGYCDCPDVGNCESCNRDDVPRIVKVMINENA